MEVRVLRRVGPHDRGRRGPALVLPPQALALKRALVLVAALVAAPVAAAAQEPVPGPYDPAVPTVADLRGFATGEGFSSHGDVARVVEGIADASPRVHLERYGASAEGRPLFLAWVSSPENLARLDAIRAENRSLMEGAPADSVDLAGRPILVWLSFGVHGDEASSPEAALELLYRLAASRDPEVRAWLENAIVIIDPLLNPDGHERYVAWYRSVAGPAPDPDPEAREHRPPWPEGRTNHWYFDLNRDWAWGVQPETRARRTAYLATLPHVHVDFHEMGPSSTYFFFPAAAPVHHFYPPTTTRWGAVFGEANAAAFDARGWPYYTEEEFDLFYPGYGDSWPSFFGATGMTYEQAGSGEAGLLLRRADGSLLSLADRAAHHLVAAATTIATAVGHRAERIADFADFWRPATRVPAGAPAAYLVPRGADADSLAALLAGQGVRVDTLAAELATAGLASYGGAEAPTALPAGTFLLRGDQPLGRYLAALMAPGLGVADTSLFYDITGWTLPYLYDVPAYHGDHVPAVAAHPWQPASARGIRPMRSAVAYAWEYASVADVVAAGRLAAAGWRVGVATRGFEGEGRALVPGTFVVAPGLQHDSLGSRADATGRLLEVLSGAGVRPIPLGSFRTVEGIDLGSDRFRQIRAPRIALAAGSGTDPSSVGAAWHLFAKIGVPIDVVHLADLGADAEADDDSLAGEGREPLALDPYTAIILPDGPGAAAFAAALGAAGTERLGAWVERGGTLIGIRWAAAWLTSGESGLTDVELAESPDPPAEERLRSREAAEKDDVRRRIPGTLLLAEIDTTSPLGYGFPGGEAAVLVRDPPEMTPAEGDNAWRYADRDPLEGYLPAAARQRLAGTPYAVVVDRGRGRIVLFADDPAFRGIVHALTKAYLNAVLLVPGS